MTAPLIGRAQRELIVQWAGRRKGVTAPEVSEHFNVDHRAAWRALQRLVERGELYKLPRKRVRSMVFGFGRAGRGADIYKTKLQEDGDEFEDEAGGASWDEQVGWEGLRDGRQGRDASLQERS